MKSPGAAEEEKNGKKGNSFSKFSSKVKDKLASLGLRMMIYQESLLTNPFNRPNPPDPTKLRPLGLNRGSRSSVPYKKERHGSPIIQSVESLRFATTTWMDVGNIESETTMTQRI